MTLYISCEYKNYVNKVLNDVYKTKYYMIKNENISNNLKEHVYNSLIFLF